MKKLIPVFLLLLCLLALSGCASESETVPTPTVAVTPAQAPIRSPAASEKVIAPLPSYLRLDALNDCSFAAGFSSPDVYLNDDGALVLSLTVYDYEQFDMVDISGLAPGDTLLLNSEQIAVSAVERDGSRVVVNGGPEAGGVCLTTDDDGVFYQLLENEAKSYYPIGEATLRVAQDFRLYDSADPGTERELYAGDFLIESENGADSFSPQATTVTVQGGWIINITRRYVP